jgi:hypothetical protein
MPSSYGLHNRHKIKMLALFMNVNNWKVQPKLEKLRNLFRNNSKPACAKIRYQKGQRK